MRSWNLWPLEMEETFEIIQPYPPHLTGKEAVS